MLDVLGIPTLPLPVPDRRDMLEKTGLDTEPGLISAEIKLTPIRY